MSKQNNLAVQLVLKDCLHAHRSAILPSILVVRNPGVPLRTTKALTCPLTLLRAQMTTTSANVALPIHRFRPFSRQPPLTCRGTTLPLSALYYGSVTCRVFITRRIAVPRTAQNPVVGTSVFI